jgi:hypothetical protein
MALYGGSGKLWDISSAYHHVERFFHHHQRRVLTRAMMLCLMIAFTMRAAERDGAWTGPYPPCDGRAEVLKREPMNLGVRFSTSNPALKGMRQRNYRVDRAAVGPIGS